EFVAELLQALIAAYLLSLTTASTFGARLGVYAFVGLAAAVATNVSYWNWYAFPFTYVAAYIFTIWVGYICAGLVATALMRRASYLFLRYWRMRQPWATLIHNFEPRYVPGPRHPAWPLRDPVPFGRGWTG